MGDCGFDLGRVDRIEGVKSKGGSLKSVDYRFTCKAELGWSCAGPHCLRSNGSNPPVQVFHRTTKAKTVSCHVNYGLFTSTFRTLAERRTFFSNPHRRCSQLTSQGHGMLSHLCRRGHAHREDEHPGEMQVFICYI